MSQKLTRWFPADVKPVRAGVYQTRKGKELSDWFQFWSGTFWGVSQKSVFDAYAEKNNPSWGFTTVEWRGLAKPQKSKK